MMEGITKVAGEVAGAPRVTWLIYCAAPPYPSFEATA